MAEKLSKKMVAAMAGLLSLPYGKQLIVFLISMMPVLELRGGLIAASLLDMDPLESYVISIIGNMLPVPFILLFIDAVLKRMRVSRLGPVRAFAGWLDARVEKHRPSIERYGFLGLVLLVGVPLPGTGAWTGCLVAGVLRMEKKKAFLAAFLGVLIASVIMMFVSFGLIAGLT